jgi:hypothetical protein
MLDGVWKFPQDGQTAAKETTMYRIDWMTPQQDFMATRWFHTREAAVRFARTRKIAVGYDPNGNRMQEV